MRGKLIPRGICIEVTVHLLHFHNLTQFHISHLMSHISCLTSHVSNLTSQFSHLLPLLTPVHLLYKNPDSVGYEWNTEPLTHIQGSVYLQVSDINTLIADY